MKLLPRVAKSGITLIIIMINTRIQIALTNFNRLLSLVVMSGDLVNQLIKQNINIASVFFGDVPYCHVYMPFSSCNNQSLRQ